MIDPFLEEIVEAAEAERPTPAVQIVTAAGDWISGLPCSSGRFREISYQRSLAEGSLQADQGRGWLDETFAEFGAPEDDCPVLSLEQAHLAFGGRGDALRLPTIRIALAAVTSWWIAGEEYEPPSTGGWFGGVMLPTGS
jgi:hypothetical protein